MKAANSRRFNLILYRTSEAELTPVRFVSHIQVKHSVFSSNNVYISAVVGTLHIRAAQSVT